jgi:hypothetical protein
MKTTATFTIRDREAGNRIETFSTYEQALDNLKDYIEEDKEAGTYTPDFYEIYNDETEENIK